MDTHDVPGKELVIGSSETAALMVLAKVGWEVGKGRGGGVGAGGSLGVQGPPGDSVDKPCFH